MPSLCWFKVLGDILPNTGEKKKTWINCFILICTHLPSCGTGNIWDVPNTQSNSSEIHLRTTTTTKKRNWKPLVYMRPWVTHTHMRTLRLWQPLPTTCSECLGSSCASSLDSRKHPERQRPAGQGHGPFISKEKTWTVFLLSGPGLTASQQLSAQISHHQRKGDLYFCFPNT